MTNFFYVEEGRKDKAIKLIKIDVTLLRAYTFIKIQGKLLISDAESTRKLATFDKIGHVG